ARLKMHIDSRLSLAAQKIETLCAREVLRNPMSLIASPAQNLDDLDRSLTEAIAALLKEAAEKLSQYREQVARIEPHRLIATMKIELNNLCNRAGLGLARLANNSRIGLSQLESSLSALKKKIIADRVLVLTAAENRLTGLNPKAVLQRGYSITTNKKTGTLVRRLTDVELGDVMITELADEEHFESKITAKKQKNPDPGKQTTMWQ
ncbi:MAG: hypothetical protein JXN61_09655, partial [Sedimentisphaerales bacterium]|nr:hypothetical protein [Sedimentisphaerales bacterium]